MYFSVCTEEIQEKQEFRSQILGTITRKSTNKDLTICRCGDSSPKGERSLGNSPFPWWRRGIKWMLTSLQKV